MVRITRVEVWNLRALKVADIALNDYTCFVGRNSAGKSTVLCALNIFFRQTDDIGTDLQSLDCEDFFGGDTSEPIRIRVTFEEMSDEALEAFKHYARGGKLVVTAEAVYDESSKRAVVTHFGERLGIEEFRPFFEAHGAGESASTITAIYDGLRARFAELPSNARSKDAKAEALRNYEAERPDACTLIPSADQFYGVSKGANRLERFVQWVYVPAVKDAIAEQTDVRNSALSKLLARAVSAKSDFDEKLADLRLDSLTKYQEILDQNQNALEEISGALTKRLSSWSHQGTDLTIEWKQDEQKSVRIEQPIAGVKIKEDAFEGQVSRLGHGMQRSFIIALLQELALYNREGAPKLILGVEEPELYQHPPQSRHLAALLKQLSEADSQVLVTTHSPFFVSGEVFEDVRLMRKNEHHESKVYSATAGAVSDLIAEYSGKRPDPRMATVARMQQVLQPQISEMFFADSLLFVEGREDVAFIQTYLELKGYWESLREVGLHVIPVDGKSELLRPIAIANSLQIPAFLVFDCDSEVKPKWLQLHENDNKGLFSAYRIEVGSAFPEHDVFAENCVAWRTDLASSVQKAVDPAVWAACKEGANVEFEHGTGMKKNVMHIASFVERLWDSDIRPEPLEKLSDLILEFAVPS